MSPFLPYPFRRMSREALIQALIPEFRKISPEKRETLLTTLVLSKASKGMDGVRLVMDPEYAQIVQPILDDENLRDVAIEVLLSLKKEEKKKKSGLFGFLRRR
jgi:hypothetical protein